jgi:hypothetical protein
MKLPIQTAPVMRYASTATISAEKGINPSQGTCQCKALKSTVNKVVTIFPSQGDDKKRGTCDKSYRPQCNYTFNNGIVTPGCQCVPKQSQILTGGIQVHTTTGAVTQTL